MTAIKTNERLLYEVLNEAWPKQWVQEHKGLEGRKFRFDCACPDKKIAIEIEGGIWLGSKGGHTSGIGYDKNMEKYNLAVLEGWKVLRYSPETLKKRSYQIIQDVRTLCGASLNDAKQTVLCLDSVKSPYLTMQRKL